MLSKAEKKRLEKIAKKIRYRKGFNGRLMYYRFLELFPYLKGAKALELGCGDGLMTEALVKYFKKVIAVDGSLKFCQEVKKRVRAENLEVICSLFEDLKLKEKFDTIIMAHILEHVVNPVKILKLAKSWLEDGGVILVDVPNANSLHRQIGVKIGLLKKVDQFSDLDKKLGHRRVYTWETLKRDIGAAGLKIKKMGGVFLKPLANSQIEKWWSQKMINAFYQLGREYPKIATEIYAVCIK